MAPRPQSTVGEPSTYVFEMITFLTAYVDSVLIGLNEDIKTRAYRNALTRINNWLMVSTSSVTVGAVSVTNRLILYRICCAAKTSPASMSLHCPVF